MRYTSRLIRVLESGSTKELNEHALVSMHHTDEEVKRLSDGVGNCEKVSKYIVDKYKIGKAMRVSVLKYNEDDESVEIVSMSNHHVISYEDRLYDFTANQYQSYFPLTNLSDKPVILNRLDKSIDTLESDKLYNYRDYIIYI